MKSFVQWLEYLAVLVVSLSSIFLAQRYFGLDKETAGIIYSGSITVFGSILAIVIGRHNENKANIEKQLRDKKVEVYQQLVDQYLDFGTAQDASTSDQVRTARTMTRLLITWGSDDALKNWIKYIVALRGDHREENLEEHLRSLNPDILKNFLDPKAEAILTIRRELGHTNKDVSKDDILTIFVPYIQKLRELQKEDR